MHGRKSREVRLRVIELRERGYTIEKIANELGVSMGSVSGWLSLANTKGVTALLTPAPHESKFAGKLTPETMYEAITRLRRGPRANGFTGTIWRERMIQQFFKNEYNVEYSKSAAQWIIKHYHLERLIRKSLRKQLKVILPPVDQSEVQPRIGAEKLQLMIYKRFHVLYTINHIQRLAKELGYIVTKRIKNR
jgi:transposase